MTRKFYRTRFTIDVLSEEPIREVDLAHVVAEITDGAWVGGPLLDSETELTPAEAAQALLEFGSTPDFFQLDDDGNDNNSNAEELSDARQTR